MPWNFNPALAGQTPTATSTPTPLGADDDPPDPRFLPARTKLSIASLDNGLTVEAQYNPRELVVTQPISWTQHEALANQTSDAMYIDFTGMQPRTMQVELLFDGAECDGGKVMDTIENIQTLAAVRDPYSPIEEMRRPHVCVVAWGDQMPKLVCVIETVVVKYQMWATDGTVLRATATVSLKEASRVGIDEKQRPKNRVRPT